MKEYRSRIWQLMVLTTVAALIIPVDLRSYNHTAQGANVAYAQVSRYFPETGRTLGGAFLNYWNANGGIALQGFPISDEMAEISITDGRVYTVQYFERAAFEFHPENPLRYNVLLQLLGTFYLNQKHSDGAAGQVPNTLSDSIYFPETGRRLGGRFKDYWSLHGQVAQFGFPITDEFIDKSELDGRDYQVQYFERAVFEYHPENPAQYQVLLAQLGKFRWLARTPLPTPTVPPPPPTSTPVPRPTNTPKPPSPTPTSRPNPCAHVPPAVNGSSDPSPCMAQGQETEFTITGFGFRPGENVGVYATNPDGSVNGAPFQLDADSQGQAVVYFTLFSSARTGIYADTMEGVETHHKSIVYIVVYAP